MVSIIKDMYHEFQNISTIRYISGGRLGDFIHQLSIINEIYIKTGKKGILYISENYRDCDYAHGLIRAYEDTKSFVNKLPYIESYKIYNGEEYDIHLSSWRESLKLGQESWISIFKDVYNIEWASSPWLFAEKDDTFKDKILINCGKTMRFPQQINFNLLLSKYSSKDLVFITENIEDYIFFNEKTGIKMNTFIPKDIEEYQTAINSCKLFIGILSSPLTYAYGLHKSNITLLNEANYFDNAHIIGLDQSRSYISYEK
jgi:hypothetical protein